MENLAEKFPKNFKFATATAAYQIEGATHLDGRGKSIWDEIREQPGRIADKSDPQQSCEGRRKYREDVELLKAIGVTSYRFSVCWSRILPRGSLAQINDDAIQYYRNLCQLLVENNIEPIITLFHADMPCQIFNDGSWLNPSNCQHFVDFARLCFEKFGDLVKVWITFNEINMQAWCAMAKFDGQPWHCPQRDDDDVFGKKRREVPYLAATNMIRTHARIYRVYDGEFRRSQNGRVGITNGGRFCFPANDQVENVEAAKRALDCLFNYTLEPILGKTGDFPEFLRKNLDFLPTFSEEDKKMIKGSVDFIAINYYLSHHVVNLADKTKVHSQQESDGNFDYVEGGYEKICGETWIRYAPDGLYELLNYIKNKYDNIPVFISENGCMDLNDESDWMEDDHRIKYINGHLEALARAIENNCNVIGYTVWSLMDNFEWDDGFAVRFGLCHVDFNDPNKRRVMKKSAHFYRDFIEKFKKHHEEWKEEIKTKK